LTEVEKGKGSSAIDEIYRLFIINKDKILPLRLLAKCAQMLINDSNI
jgi:hypothetical protein